MQIDYTVGRYMNHDSVFYRFTNVKNLFSKVLHLFNLAFDTLVCY